MQTACATVSERLALHKGWLLVSERLSKTLVRATRLTTQRTVAVDEELAVEQVVVTRAPIGSVVEAIPATREENGVMIVPVVEKRRIRSVRNTVCNEEVEIKKIPGTNAYLAKVGPPAMPTLKN